MFFSNDSNFYKQLLRLTIPIYFQQLLKISVDTINSLMIGSINQIRMSALSQANQVFFVFFTLVNGFSVGCSVLVSQYWGKKDYESISMIISHSIKIVAIFSLVFSGLVYTFPHLFMRIYSSDPTIIMFGSTYLRTISLMFVVCGISTVLFGASRGIEQVRIILVTNIVSYSINILLDYLFIFGKFGFPVLGIQGVAIGTVVARIIEFLFCAVFFLREPTIPFMLKDLTRTDKKLRNSLLKISIPMVGHELVWSLGTSSGSMITGQLGKSAVAGYNVSNVLYDILASLGNGFMMSAGVVLGMTLGKGESEEAKRQANSIMGLSLVMGFVMMALSFIFKNSFLSLYKLDPDAISYAKQFIDITAIVWPASYIEMVTMVTILRAGGDGRVGFYTDLVVMWMICIPLAWLAAFRFNAQPWLVVAIIKSIIVLEAIVGVLRVYSYKWVRNLTN